MQEDRFPRRQYYGVNRQFSHELKLRRALHHLDSLEAKVREWIRAWRERRPYDYVVEIDREKDEKLVKVQLLEPPPAEFRLIIGDCLHNLRSALDNLVYELALAHLGFDYLPERRARVLEFPIFGDREMKVWECRNKIGCIHPDAQAVIKGLQPHNRGDEFASDPLWELHRLSNIDKHRVPHITLLAVESVVDVPSAPHLPGTLNIFLVPFEDGAKIASYRPATGYFDPKVHMDPLFNFGIAFGQGSATPGSDCRVTLRRLHGHITNVVLPGLVVPFLSRP